MLPLVRDYVLPAAYSLLPNSYRSEAATRLLLAIGIHESQFVHRQQVGGPAVGFWQFEQGGVMAVLGSKRQGPLAQDAMGTLKFPNLTPYGCQVAVLNNDVAAAVFARLLLAKLPDPLALSATGGFDQYARAWKPGRSRQDDWQASWDLAALHTRAVR